MTSAYTPSKLLILGVSLLSLGACVAQASSPAPDDDDDGNSNGNKAGSTGLVTGGSTNNPGNNPGTGGTSNQGTAGTSPGSAGTPAGTAGTAPVGTGGGGALAACPSPPAAGMATELIIDDLEDKDNAVSKIGGRSGFWYTYLDTYGSDITPKPDATGAAPLVPGSTNCHGGMGCIIVSGTTAAADETAMKYPYAGVGFDFSNAKKPCVYNGSAYTGIKFWARGDVEITIKVNITGTADAAGGGTCATGCSNGHGKKVVLTPDWAEIDLPFASIMQDPTWGTQVAFDKTQLLSLQVQFPSGVTYAVALDDFTFY
jgi:hypothetical protein